MQFPDQPTTKTTSPPDVTVTLGSTELAVVPFIGSTVGISVVSVAVVAAIVITIIVALSVNRRRKKRRATAAQIALQNQRKAVGGSLWSTEQSKSISASSDGDRVYGNIEHPSGAPIASARHLRTPDCYSTSPNGLLSDTGNKSSSVDAIMYSSDRRLRTSRLGDTRVSAAVSLHENAHPTYLSEPTERLSSSPRSSLVTRCGSAASGSLMLPVERWRSMASADSGLASSLASFADADHSQPGLSSSRHSLSSYDSLAAPIAYAPAAALTATLSRRACSDGSCRSSSCIRCSTALVSLDCARGAQQQTLEMVEETNVGCTREAILALVRQFEELRLAGQVSVGVVYGTPSFAIADLDKSGGCLFTADRSCSLTVPPGALDRRQTVYFGVIYENSSSSDSGEEYAEINFTPTFECGPDGLRFLKPVHLRTQHCAGPGSDLGQVTSFVREGGRADWSAESDAGVTYEGGEAVLYLTHFTGYKLATRVRSGRGAGNGSRIPRLVAQPPQVTKELYLCSFRCDGKVRVYYMGRDDSLYDKICAQEFVQGNTLNSPKKPFLFTYNYGDLLVHANVCTPRRLDCQAVMTNSYDYAELCKIQGVSNFDIHIRQENGGPSCTIVATFDSHGRSNEFSPSCESLGETTLRLLTTSPPVTAPRLASMSYPSHGSDMSTMLPDAADRRSGGSAKAGVAATTACSQATAGLPGSSSLSISLASPAESCECAVRGSAAAGEASCCNAYHCRLGGSRCLSPGEHSDDSVSSSLDNAPQPLQRDRRTRASKESGYASVTSFAELQGPQTMMDVGARGATSPSTFQYPRLQETDVQRRNLDDRYRSPTAGETEAEPCTFSRRQPQLTAVGNAAREDDEDDDQSRTLGRRASRKPLPLPRSSRRDACSS